MAKEKVFFKKRLTNFTVCHTIIFGTKCQKNLGGLQQKTRFGKETTTMIYKNARISKAIYLIDDNEHPFAGWEFDNRGLALKDRAAYAQFDFIKVHPEFDTLLTRKFRKQTDSVVTLEINFLIDCPDGFAVRLYDNEKKTALALLTRGGFYTLSDGTQTGIPVCAGKNSFKAVVDLKKRLYTAYINNQDAGIHALPEDIHDLHFISIGIEKGYTGSLGARGVKLYADYFCNERFLAPFEGEIPCDWRVRTEGGKIGMKTSSGYTFSKEDTYYLDVESGKRTVLEKALQNAGGELCFELKFLEKSETFHAAFLLNNFGLRAENGKLFFADGTAICTYPREIWNTLRLEMTDDGVLVRVNGKDKGVFQMPHAEAFHALRIEAFDDTHMALDDILLYGLAPLPADYVEEPKPVKEKGYHVGLHVFSSWRYGFWRGRHDATWDVCSPYDEITPYMGYYDEGIPEVADWENKWFCEHGIDFQLQCWYGPTVIDEPIKFPGFSHALHDGYFNSVYKNYSKFAIMWENNFTKAITPEAFEKYLVPFFIEYYFKDPGYYKIDGKPVFSIYTIGTLAKPEYFGSIEQARKELDFLREAVKKAGMPDIILLCAGGSGTENDIKFREALGVEGTYAYNWGTESYTAEYQENMLTNAMETFSQYATSVVHVPTVGVGFNCVARHDARHPSISIPEYEKILTWTRDNYLTNTRQFPDQSAWQSKMVLLSCWNEFDEGHYINPSGLHGFGFLDTLRKVFCEAPEHTDKKPTENQKRRIDILYPEGHAWLRPERRLEPPKPSPDAKIIKTYDFADVATYDAFRYEVNAVNKTHKNGALCGVSNGIDPQIFFAGDIGINADSIAFIRIYMKVFGVTGREVKGGPQIFFATETNPKLSGDKMLSCTYTLNENGYAEALFSCVSQPNWKGHVTTFRIDPTSSGGSWEIQKLEFIEATEKAEKVCVNGVDVNIGLPLSKQNGIPFVPLYARNSLLNRMNAAYRWNRAKRELTLIIGETEMTFTEGSDVYLLNGKPAKLPGKVVPIDGVPAVPLETVCAVVGYGYSFEDGTVSVTVE